MQILLAFIVGAAVGTGIHFLLHQRLTRGVVVAPMVGFDEGNYRLGYGGGYFDRTLAVNLKGTFFVSQEVGRGMLRRRSGRDLLAAETGQRRLGENFPRQPDGGAEIAPVLFPAHIVEADARRLGGLEVLRLDRRPEYASGLRQQHTFGPARGA